jgi:hypothetical protein
MRPSRLRNASRVQKDHRVLIASMMRLILMMTGMENTSWRMMNWTVNRRSNEVDLPLRLRVRVSAVPRRRVAKGLASRERAPSDLCANLRDVIALLLAVSTSRRMWLRLIITASHSRAPNASSRLVGDTIWVVISPLFIIRPTRLLLLLRLLEKKTDSSWV